jgi:hypothetical protein
MGGRVNAAIAIAAACCIGAQGVSAGPAGDGDSARVVFFSGTDLWHHGKFIHGGLLWSPDGLDREGLTFKAAISGGFYRYISGALGNKEVTGRELTAQFMPGWRFKAGSTEVKVFAGIDLQNHRLNPDDPASGLRGPSAGVRVAFDLWSEPTPTTMLAADGALSSIATGYSLRAATGWRVNDRFYLGPEAQAFASRDYRQLRFGLHLTGLKIEPFEWSAAAGLASDSDRRSGAYVRLGVLTRR